LEHSPRGWNIHHHEAGKFTTWLESSPRGWNVHHNEVGKFTTWSPASKSAQENSKGLEVSRRVSRTQIQLTNQIGENHPARNIPDGVKALNRR
jgi:hypothetical protein